MYTPTGKKIGGGWMHASTATKRIATIALVAFLVPMMATPASAASSDCGSSQGGATAVETGHLSGPGDSHWYSVNLDAGETFHAVLLDTGGIGMGIYGPDTQTCGKPSSLNGSISYTATTDGSYRVQVYGSSSGGDYTLISATAPGIQKPIFDLIYGRSE